MILKGVHPHPLYRLNKLQVGYILCGALVFHAGALW